MNKTPHVHAACIKAWADGALIQYRSSQTSSTWQDISSPSWRTDCEYRVKPEPKPDVVKYRNVYEYAGYANLDNCRREDRIARIGIEKIIIDGETGKLKRIEIVE